ncbi:hypothetical protein AGLY_006762 [Aphis glycines]|uniref:Reverse transcriptase domain-containing protein n=1 Tax=Aphis glycines TaxID=307491 RepID=A0A6G0TR32_APHGL|nr:hypothetical protein AGLY_006762 [Aphis glycines]
MCTYGTYGGAIGPLDRLTYLWVDGEGLGYRNCYISDTIFLKPIEPIEGSILSHLKIIPEKIICFADDTVILLKSPCINNLYKMAEESFIIVKNWLDNNSLEINSVKTNYIHFGIQKAIDLNNYKIIAHTNSCLFNNNKNNICKCRELNRVNSIKYLGFAINSFLWNFFLGGTYTHIRNLEITLNSLLKFIFNKPALFPTVNLYKELENICLLFYNMKTNIYAPCHNYNTRFKANTNVIVPKMNTVFGQQNPKYNSISCHTVVGVAAVETARFSQQMDIGESTLQYILIYLSAIPWQRFLVFYDNLNRWKDALKRTCFGRKRESLNNIFGGNFYFSMNIHSTFFCSLLGLDYNTGFGGRAIAPAAPPKNVPGNGLLFSLTGKNSMIISEEDQMDYKFWDNFHKKNNHFKIKT